MTTESTLPADRLRFLRQGWGSVSLNDHTLVVHRSGRAFYTRNVSGWLTRLNQEDLGVNLARDSRWAIGISLQPDAPPFMVIPGCRVTGIQEFTTAPTTIGFASFDEIDNYWRVVHPDAPVDDLPRNRPPKEKQS